MKRVQTACGIVVAFLCTGATGLAEGATFYAALNGNDANSCAQAQSISTPKRTVTAGASCLQPGDTLFVRAGTSRESLIDKVPSGSSWSAPIRIAAYTGETVWLKPSSGYFVFGVGQNQQYVEFDRINMDGANTTHGVIKIEAGFGGNPHHIRIKNAEIVGTPADSQAILATAGATVVGGNEFINLTIHGGGRYDYNHGIYLQSSNNLVEGCTLYDLAGAAIQVYNGYGVQANNNVIRNNTIRNLRTGVQNIGPPLSPGRHWGIIIYSTNSGTQVYNNVVHSIPSNGGNTAGIEVVASNVLIANNTVYGVSGAGVRIGGGSSNSVRNNIAYGNSTNYIEIAGTIASNNLFGADPLFVDANGGNFRPKSTSPAIDKGMTVSSVATDIAKVARPQGGSYDIGAYEIDGAPVEPLLPPVDVQVIVQN